MKKLNLTILFTVLLGLSHAVMAESYLVYSAPKETKWDLIKNRSALSVFTDKEKELLANSPVLSDVLKVELTKEQAKELRENGVTLERNHAQELYSEPFSSLQWNLDNKGEDLLQWTSDIDAVTIEGRPGEDIDSKEAKEDVQKEIIVAVVDSGVDINHPDLKDAILVKDNECKAQKEYKKCLATNSDRASCHKKYANFDSDKNGYPMDCAGWSVGAKSIPGSKVDGASDVSDNQGHGTHVAGIIAARKNNYGIEGVSQSAKILPVKVAVAS